MRPWLAIADGMNASTTDAILDAGIALLAEAGPRAASVRGIADRAGVRPAALQHHFPTKALLTRAIYERASTRHVAASAEALAQCARLGAAEALMPEAAISLLGIWRGGLSRETAVMLHMLAQAARDVAYADIARNWVEQTIARIGQGLGCGPDHAEFIVELLTALTLASAPSAFGLASDVLNREFIPFALGDRRTGPDSGHGYHLFRARAAATRLPRSALDSAAGMVASAALDAGIAIMAESGAEALSYRTIAARAGVASSSILYNFPTRAALVMAIYEEIHRRFATPTIGLNLPQGRPSEQIIGLFTPMIVDEKAGAAPLVLASCELFLAAWWEPELADSAWAMRLARGARAEDGHEVSAEKSLTTHFLSVWTIGLSLAQLSRHPADLHHQIGMRLATGMAIAGLDSGEPRNPPRPAPSTPPAKK